MGFKQLCERVCLLCKKIFKKKKCLFCIFETPVFMEEFDGCFLT